MAGAALVGAADRLVEQLRPLAAEQLEAAEADLRFDRGVFRIAGTDRTLAVPALLQAAGRDAATDSDTVARAGTTFPNGCHVAEVSVDTETGHCAVERFVVVDDFGTIVNPLTTTGQVMGGVVQGIGQALMERVHYDGASGQLLTGSLMDYALPRASDVCDIEVAFDESAPTALNVLGAKGCGEAGCCGALPAVVNGVANALASVGVSAVPMPLTSSNVWAAMSRASVG